MLVDRSRLLRGRPRRRVGGDVAEHHAGWELEPVQLGGIAPAARAARRVPSRGQAGGEPERGVVEEPAVHEEGGGGLGLGAARGGSGADDAVPERDGREGHREGRGGEEQVPERLEGHRPVGPLGQRELLEPVARVQVVGERGRPAPAPTPQPERELLLHPRHVGQLPAAAHHPRDHPRRRDPQHHVAARGEARLPGAADPLGRLQQATPGEGALERGRVTSVERLPAQRDPVRPERALLRVERLGAAGRERGDDRVGAAGGGAGQEPQPAQLRVGPELLQRVVEEPGLVRSQ